MSSDKFEPENYRDEYRLRVLALVDAKIKGRQIVATLITRKPAPVIDLMDEAEHEGSREKSCQRSQGAEDSVKGLTASANKRLGMDPTTALNVLADALAHCRNEDMRTVEVFAALKCACRKCNRSMAL